MIVVQALLMVGIAEADFHIHPLDGRASYQVRVSRTEPTTCVFPGPIAALEGGNVSMRAEDDPPVLLSHQPGTNFFSLRALKDDARAALNVIYRGRVYALTFVGAAEPDRAVIFEEPSVPAAVPMKPATADALPGLLSRARNHDLIVAQYPMLAAAAERAKPGTATQYPGFKAVVVEVIRFDAEDVLVCRVRLENTGARAIRFDPSGLAIRVGKMVYPSALTEAAGEIPASGNAEAWVAILGDGHGNRANLSVQNTFFVIVPTAP